MLQEACATLLGRTMNFTATVRLIRIRGLTSGCDNMDEHCLNKPSRRVDYFPLIVRAGCGTALTDIQATIKRELQSSHVAAPHWPKVGPAAQTGGCDAVGPHVSRPFGTSWSGMRVKPSRIPPSHPTVDCRRNTATNFFKSHHGAFTESVYQTTHYNHANSRTSCTPPLCSTPKPTATALCLGLGPVPTATPAHASQRAYRPEP